MSRALVNTLISEGRIKLLDEKYCEFKCLNCGKMVKVTINYLRDKGQDFNFRQQCRVCNQEETFLLKYGVSRPAQSDEVKEKTKETFKEHFGVDNPQKNKEVREKTQKTNLKKYGKTCNLAVECFKEQKKETYIKNWGVDNPSKSEILKKKKEQTSLKNFGKPYYAQTSLSLSNRKYVYEYDGLRFDSSWELAYYIYCVDKGVPIERVLNPIPYGTMGKSYYYFPDFKVNGNQLVEIKGGHFFSENNELMNPFDKSEIAKLKNTAKQKCMEENNVLIIGKEDIVPYLNYIKDNYGKDYLKRFLVR